MYHMASSKYTFTNEVFSNALERVQKGLVMKRMMHEEMPVKNKASRYGKSRSRRRGRMVMLVVLVSLLVVLVVGSLGIGYRLLNPTPVRTSTERHTFQLGTSTHSRLIVTNDSGFVHVQQGTGNTVTVTATKIGDSFGASPDDFQISYSQNGDTISIHVNNNSIHPFDFSAASQADLMITVPTSSDLQLETNSGDIAVTGIQGKLTLTSGSGSLQATGVSLKSGTQLGTDSGRVTVQGSIDTNGQYTFLSNSGDITVALSGSASFHAKLVSNSGTITNGFPLTPTQQADSSNVSGDVGSSPQATVVLQSNSGSLHLKQM